MWGFRGSGCPGDWLWPSLPLQYGMLLYQNYRIPQQRKAMLSHFSTPVVSQAAPLKPHSSSAAASARAVGIFSQMRLPRGARIADQHAFPRRWTLSSQQCDCWEQIPLYPLPFPTSPCSIALVNGSHWELYSSVQNVDSAHVYWGAAFTTFASVHFSQGVHGAVDHDARVLVKIEIVMSLPVISGWTLCLKGAETVHPPQIWS